MEGRERFRINFPKLDGYRVELPDDDIWLDLDNAPVFEIGPNTVPTWVEMGGVVGKRELNAVDLTIPGLICPVSLGCLLGRSPKR